MYTFKPAPRRADVLGKPYRAAVAGGIGKDITSQRLLKLPLVPGGKSGEIGRLAAVKRLAEAAHPLRHREIPHSHLAQVAIEVAAKHVEELLPDAASRIGAVAEPLDQQHQMQHDQIEAALNRIGHPIVTVKCRRAGLCHDRAIELIDVAILGMGAK